MEDIQVKNFERMDVLHHLLAGFKAYFSEELIIGVEKCRRSAGGAGYASFSGFSEIHSAVSPVPTYEGDNTVMLLQASRYIFKLVKKTQKKQPLAFPFDYIGNIESLLSLKGKGSTVEEMFDLKNLETALAVRSAYQIKETMLQMGQNKQNSLE